MEKTKYEIINRMSKLDNLIERKIIKIEHDNEGNNIRSFVQNLSYSDYNGKKKKKLEEFYKVINKWNIEYENKIKRGLSEEYRKLEAELKTIIE